MSKSVPDTIMTSMLELIANNADSQGVTSDSGTPSDLTNELATASMTTSTSGDYSITEGDAGAGSQKLTMSAKSGVNVDASGTPNHVVLYDSTDGNAIKLITTCSGPDLTNGSTVDFPSWDYELGIPS